MILPRTLAQHPQVAPLVVGQRGQRFGVGRGRRHRRAAHYQARRQVRPGGAAGEGRQPEEGQRRRRQVDQSHRAGQGRSSGQAGTADHERHLQRGFVGEEAMPGLVVLAERLAVIGRDDDQGVVPELANFQAGAQAPQQRVGPCHLAVVRAIGESCREGLRRFVGIVGVVEMHPQRRALRLELGRTAVEPALDARDRLIATTLNGSQRQHFASIAGVEGVVVVIEPAIEARLQRQHERGHEGGGGEALGRQGLGQRRDVFGQRQRNVVAHAVFRRVPRREERGVRWTGDRHVAGGVERPHALDGEPIEVGGRDSGVAIGAEPVRPQRVDGDDDQMPWRDGRRRWRRRRRTGGAHRDEHRDSKCRAAL